MSGLKFQVPICDLGFVPVSSYTDEWIEILTTSQFLYSKMVSSYTDEWIEMLNGILLGSSAVVVSSYTDEWIEI